VPAIEDLRLLTGECLDKKSPFVFVLAGQPLLRERLSEPKLLSAIGESR
jgi:type II secretory pathway predicted ATPase ExeA